jgi:hypothetical protein
MQKFYSGWCLVLLFACGGLYSGLWSEGHDWGDDFAAYIMQAISIVNGSADQFVERNAFTMNQSSSPMGPVAYPWGFPLLLAPVYSVFGMSLVAFKAVGLVFYLLFLLTLWFGFKPLLKPVELVVFVALFAFNPVILSVSDNILSDVPFLFFSTLSIVMLSRLSFLGGVRREFAYTSILGVMMGSAFLVRTNGALLVLAYVAMLAFPALRKLDGFPSSNMFFTRKSVLLSLPFVFFALTIAIPLLFLPDGQNSHLSHLSRLSLSFLFQNVIYYAELLKEFFSPNTWRFQIGFFIYMLTIPFVVLGIRSAWRKSLAMLLYSLMTIGLYVVWPYQQGLRFIFPIIPIYIYFLIVGLRGIGQVMPPIGQSYILPLAGLALIFAASSTFAVYQNQMSGRPVPQGPYTPQAGEMFAFIMRNTAADDIIVFHKPRVISLLTGRSSIRINRIDELARGDFLVIDEIEWAFQISRQEKEALISSSQLDAVFSNAQFEVYRLKKAVPR